MADELNTLVLSLDSGGDVVIRLRPDLAPAMSSDQPAGSGRLLRRRRVPPRDPRLHGAGRRPTGTGSGGSKLPDLKAEFNAEPHKRGTCSMARTNSPNTANSQFFICFDDAASSTAIYGVGRSVEGMEHVDALPKGEPPRTPARS
jgi:peptidylprolyl isomerase